MKLPSLMVFVLTSFALTAQARDDAGKTTKTFEPAHLGKLVGVGDPQISPDGKSIIVRVGRPNYEKNRYDAELVLVDIASGKQRVLTYERQGLGRVRWSPTGDRLAFLAAAGNGKDAKPQVFVLPMNGGDAKRVTDAPEGVRDFAWKPDGKEFAYAAPDEADAKKDKHDDAFEVGNNDFLASAAPRPIHAWIVSSEGGKARRLTSGSWTLTSVPPPGPPSSPLAWTPDGTALAIVRQERPHDGDNDLTIVQILDAATGKLRSLTGRKDFESFPSFSPDGSQVAYWYPRDGDPNFANEIHVAPFAGGKGKSVTRDLDRCLYLSHWMPDGQSLLVGGNDRNRVSMWVQPVDGPAKRLELGQVCPSWFFGIDAAVGKNGVIAFTGSTGQRPTELYHLPAVDAAPQRLTDFNAEVAALDLGRMDTIEWKVGNFAENGILIYPPGFDKAKKYPLVLLIHGGPQAASTEMFSSLAQCIAARGYVVFEPNYRGSDNLGNAYQAAIVKDWGKGPGEDVMAGLAAVKKLGFVDDSRIAVTGWSYGGYMTSWLIGNYPGIWKTAIAGAAVTDWNDHYNFSDGNVLHRFLFGGSPWKGDFDKSFREQSPIAYATKIRTPTLIVATTGDARVPITQSYRLYHALKDNDVPVKFVAYPVPGHYPGDPVRQRDLFKRWIAWLDEYLK